MHQFGQLIRALNAASSPGETLDALDGAAAPLRLLGIWRIRPGSEVIVSANEIFYHDSVPLEFQTTSLALIEKFGMGPMTQYALTSPPPFTFTEAMQLLQPAKTERRFFELLQRHGIRDGLYCPHGPWMAVFWSAHVLKAKYGLSHETRMALDAAGSVAIIRMKHLMARKKKTTSNPTLSPREITTLRHLSFGEDPPAIAKSLGVSEETVRTFIKRAQRKLKARNFGHAIAIAMRKRLI